MSKHKHHKHRSKQAEEASKQPYMGIALQQRDDLQSSSFGGSTVNLTPGRAPAEGGEEEYPSHERWEQDTYDRPPAEGPDMEESPIPSKKRSPGK